MGKDDSPDSGDRFPYDPPRLFDLGSGVAHAAPPCRPGGGPGGVQCNAGSSAGNKCFSGGNAGVQCSPGGAAAGGRCNPAGWLQAGSAAREARPGAGSASPEARRPGTAAPDPGPGPDALDAAPISPTARDRFPASAAHLIPEADRENRTDWERTSQRAAPAAPMRRSRGKRFLSHPMP